MLTDQHLEVVFTAVFVEHPRWSYLGWCRLCGAGGCRRRGASVLLRGPAPMRSSLVHGPSQSLFERPFVWFGRGLSGEASACVLWAVGVSAGVGAQYILETPLETVARPALDRIIAVGAHPDPRLER